jgi:hypothetical protein
MPENYLNVTGLRQIHLHLESPGLVLKLLGFQLLGAVMTTIPANVTNIDCCQIANQMSKSSWEASNALLPWLVVRVELAVPQLIYCVLITSEAFSSRSL